MASYQCRRISDPYLYIMEYLTIMLNTHRMTMGNEICIQGCNDET